MKYIRNYKVFENNTDLTDDQKDFLDEYTNGTWEVNPDTGLIDVQGGFHCSNKDLNDFKGLRFGKVTEYFLCGGNKLKSLNGSPKKVGGGFYCWKNPLITLEGAPLEIGEYFGFGNFLTIYYNLNAFLKEIKEDQPGVTELLLTHHFLTPEVIKQKIQEDDDFCIAVGRAWNTEGFKNKRKILENPSNPNGLSPEILQKIKDFSAVSGYL